MNNHVRVGEIYETSDAALQELHKRTGISLEDLVNISNLGRFSGRVCIDWDGDPEAIVVSSIRGDAHDRVEELLGKVPRPQANRAIVSVSTEGPPGSNMLVLPANFLNRIPNILRPLVERALRAVFGERPGQSIEDQGPVLRLALVIFKIFVPEHPEVSDARALPEATDSEDAMAFEFNRRSKLAIVPTKEYQSDTGIYCYSADSLGGKEIAYRMQDTLIQLENFIRVREDGGGDIVAKLRDSEKRFRQKGDLFAVGNNIRELGLQPPFKVRGKEIIEDLGDYRKGIVLRDLLRSQEKHPYLQRFTKIQGIEKATEMFARIHGKAGRGIGELLDADILLLVGGEDKITGARLMLPDTVYGPYIEPDEQQAMDLIDFCLSLGSAAMEVAQDEEQGFKDARDFISTCLNTYNPDAKVRGKIRQIIEDKTRYKLNLHQTARLGYDKVPKNKRKKMFLAIREMILE